MLQPDRLKMTGLGRLSTGALVTDVPAVDEDTWAVAEVTGTAVDQGAVAEDELRMAGSEDEEGTAGKDDTAVEETALEDRIVEEDEEAEEESKADED